MPLNITDRLGRTPVYNDAGQIAMRHLRDARLLVECGGGKNPPQYVFHMRFNICMSWVEEKDVPCCLNVVGGCCGQAKPGVIVLATAEEIRRWNGESER